MKGREGIGIWSHALVGCSYFLPPTLTFQSLLLCVCVFFFRVRELTSYQDGDRELFAIQLLLVWVDVTRAGGAAHVQHDTLSALSSRRIKYLLVKMNVATKVSGSWFSGGTLGFVVVSYVRTHFWGLFCPLSFLLFETRYIYIVVSEITIIDNCIYTYVAIEIHLKC